MKRSIYPILVIIVLLYTSNIWSQQQNTASDMYIDYQAYFNALGKSIMASKNQPLLVTAEETIVRAAHLKEDMPPTNIPAVLTGKLRKMSAEDIFSSRKNGVLVIGKLYKHQKDQPGVQFDIAGTGFVLSANGTCMTNYHVLKNIIHPGDAEKNDSLYFVITNDSKLFYLTEIQAYSLNNDIALFQVNTQGQQLCPIPVGSPAKVGADVYCISHPGANLYYFSKGMVARNITTDSLHAAAGYSAKGARPIRMEITADYGIGSSGGPILDQYGNLTGMVSSTNAINFPQVDKEGHIIQQPQMVVKDAIPLKAILDLIRGH